jgi:hypothetical protein
MRLCTHAQASRVLQNAAHFGRVGCAQRRARVVCPGDLDGGRRETHSAMPVAAHAARAGTHGPDGAKREHLSHDRLWVRAVG